MKTRILFAVLLAMLLLTCISCSKKGVPSRDDPAYLMYEILTSMSTGQIDHSKIIYDTGQEPLPLLKIPGVEFGDFVFKVEEIKLKYDNATQTIAYSCVVPHPGVAFWQWDSVNTSELNKVPNGIRIEGYIALVKNGSHGWRLRVTDNFNPISLYNKVASSINMVRFMFTRTSQEGQRISSEVITLGLASIISGYADTLNIPEKDRTDFSKRMITESFQIMPSK